MKKLRRTISITFFALSLGLMVGSASSAEDSKTFSEAEIDQMLAPIALYPDSLLSQVLMAATYPADVAKAVEWSKSNPDQKGDAAAKAVQDTGWDPSVMSLVAFPQILSMMGEKPDWVQNMGDAFLADSEAVMDSVQKLRKKAKEEGNLENNEQQKIVVEEDAQSKTVIIIEPAQPEVVYVPAYNPTIVYGSWWWPAYRPWYYYPPGYVVGTAIVWGIGIHVTHSLWGGFHWHGGYGHRSVNINIKNYNNININNKISGKGDAKWKHNAKNRKGVPYRDAKTRQKFENRVGGADKRQDFRGRDAQREKASATLGKRGADPREGRKELQGAGGDKARKSVDKANRDRSRDDLKNRDAGKAREGANRANRPSKPAKPAARKARPPVSNNHALRGAGNAQRSRQNVNRGARSTAGMANRAGGGRRR